MILLGLRSIPEPALFASVQEFLEREKKM